MIFSANYWKRNIEWMIEIELSSSPNSIIMNNLYGSSSVPFTQNSDVVKLSVISPTKSFTLNIDSEDKILTFENNEEFNAMAGTILAPKEEDIWGASKNLYIPICQLNKIDIKIYNMNGEELIVQSRNHTPFWELNFPFVRVNQNYLNYVNIPSWKITISAFGVTRYLVSKETNTWNELRSIPFRAVVSNVIKPQLEWRSALIFPNDLYNKTYYADFTAMG